MRTATRAMLVDKVKSALREIDWSTKTQTTFKPGEWTPDIKASIGQVGFGEGYSVWASGLVERDEGTARLVNQEWLFDMTWLAYEGRGPERKFKSLALALESELSTKTGPDKWADVVDDFEKLVIARACLKVMVFQRDCLKDTIKRFEILRSKAKDFNRADTDTEYLLAAIVWSENRFEFLNFRQDEKCHAS